MLKVNAASFLYAVGACERVALLTANIDKPPVFDLDANLDDETVESAKKHLGIVRDHSISLGIKATVQSVQRALASLDRPITGRQLGDINKDISSRLSDELAGTSFLYLEPSVANYFEQPEPLFGALVNQRFPSAAFEIDEAGKCLALSRSTAAVFHLMRSLEIVVRSIARSLGIDDPIKDAERNWGIILKAIKAELEARNSGTKKWKKAANKVFVAEIYASLDAVRNVWRNATMHVDKVYTDEEASHIFISVKSLMKKVADVIDEEGKPRV